MFVLVIKRFFILSLLFLAYGTLLAHNLVPHTHHEKAVEHHSDHHHHDHEDENEEGTLSLLLAEVIHVSGSAESFVSHTTSSVYKFSALDYQLSVSDLSFKSYIVSESKHPPSFREERVLSFSVTNASLRAPPEA